MGVVVMKSDLIFIDRGYPDSTITLYVYCDHCGSFDVSPYWNLRRRFALGISAALLLLVIVFGIFRSIIPLPWLILISVFCIIPLRILWGNDNDDEYKCRKCGRISGASYNTLGLSRGSVKVDIPDRVVQKLFWDFGGPESYGVNLDDELKPPERPDRFTWRDYLRQVAHAYLLVLSFPLIIIGLMLFGILSVFAMFFGALWVDILSKPMAKIFHGKKGKGTTS